MFRNLLMCKTREPPEYRYRAAWRARLAELKRLDNEGRAKLEAAQRIATIPDTSLLKHWWPECEENAETDKDAGTAPRRTDTGVAPPHAATVARHLSACRSLPRAWEACLQHMPRLQCMRPRGLANIERETAHAAAARLV